MEVDYGIVVLGMNFNKLVSSLLDGLKSQTVWIAASIRGQEESVVVFLHPLVDLTLKEIIALKETL